MFLGTFASQELRTSAEEERWLQRIMITVHAMFLRPFCNGQQGPFKFAANDTHQTRHSPFPQLSTPQPGFYPPGAIHRL